MWPRNSFFRKVGAPSWLRSFTLRALLYALAVLLWWPSGASAQTASLTPREGAANPLAALNREVKQVLADAQVPFTENQERAIALMMEERRRASEDLFGDLFDFSGGPTEGAGAKISVSDRRSTGCEASFSRTSRGISPKRRSSRGRHIWPRAGAPIPPLHGRRLARPSTSGSTTTPSPPKTTASTPEGAVPTSFRAGGGGAWHGNTEFLLKDDGLNARNAFVTRRASQAGATPMATPASIVAAMLKSSTLASGRDP